MARQRYDIRGAVPQHIVQLAKETYGTWVDGKRQQSESLRRRLRRMIRRALDRDRFNVRLWCLLGDTYRTKDSKAECFRQALRIDPLDPEANAELAELYAKMGKPEFAIHLDAAVENSRGVDIEDSILYTAMEAARLAGDEVRRQHVCKLGLERFPGR